MFQGKSRKTSYTFNSLKHGQYTVQAVAVKRYSKGRYGRHKSKWFTYAMTGLPVGILPAQVFELYRQCFGIESSYRQMNQVRARLSAHLSTKTRPIERVSATNYRLWRCQTFVKFHLYDFMRFDSTNFLKPL